MPRFYCPLPLQPGSAVQLPPTAARHAQVLRLQPGSPVTLFNGQGGEYRSAVVRMGRSEVEVEVLAHDSVERETTREVHLALGMPANDRMDWLLEKTCELGVAGVQPLQLERSVLRLSTERAEKKLQHWHGIIVAACEQCGRNRLPALAPVTSLPAWLAGPLVPRRLVLSLQPDSVELAQLLPTLGSEPLVLLSGPEGGLSPAEEQAARAHGFTPVSLGTRTLRADTAPLAALAALTLLA